MAAGKSLDKAGHVFAPLHREGGQLQPSDPAFGPRLQRGDLLSRQG